MRLLTHNYLQSNVKGTTKGYPLIIQASKVVLIDSCYSNSSDTTTTTATNNNNIQDYYSTMIEMVSRIIYKINYIVLQQAYVQIIDTLQEQSIGIKDEQERKVVQQQEHNSVLVEVDTTNTSEQQQQQQEALSLLTILPKALPNEIPKELLQFSNQQQHIQVEDDDTKQTDETNIDNNKNNNKIIPEIYDIYRALFDIHVMDGILICPDTQRQFIIKDGIPNMILHEDEI